jgi:hypothetical protein
MLVPNVQQTPRITSMLFILEISPQPDLMNVRPKRIDAGTYHLTQLLANLSVMDVADK